MTKKQPKKKTRKPAPAARSQPRSTRSGFLTVGQTARVLGISPSTLRVWENVGLVTPARSNGRFRLYTPELLEKLKQIQYLREVKQFSVPSIKEMLNSEKTNAVEPETADRRDMGPKLRRLRERCELGLAEAAGKAGISTGFLSAIELGRSHPSVATIYRLVAAYGTTVLELYDLPHRSNRLVRPKDRRVLETHQGICMELLSFGNTMLECMMFRVPPNSGSDGAYSHEGEEFIYLMSGNLEVWLDESECYVMHPGDSLWFESNIGHRFFNTSKEEEAVLIWVNTPPTF